MTNTPTYVLKLSEPELDRFRLLARLARANEADIWQRAGVVPGARVADIGCGPGAILAELAEAVGPDGRVTGVDVVPSTVEVAAKYTAAAGNVDVIVGRAEDTGLEPGSFDVVMLRHVLSHNKPVEAEIIAHLVTLLRPGGCLYLADFDATGMRYSVTPEPALEHMLRTFFELHAGKGNDLRAGVRLAQRLREAGLEVIEHHGRYDIMPQEPGSRPPMWAAREAMVAAGLATRDDVAGWERALERLDASTEHPTIFSPTFVAVGRLTTRPTAQPTT